MKDKDTPNVLSRQGSYNQPLDNPPLSTLVTNILRPTETCKQCSEVLYTRSSGLREERILAIISSDTECYEQNCVFLLKRNGSHSVSLKLVLPILADFRISMSQSKPVNLNDNSTVAASKSELLLKISSGGKELNLDLQSMANLQETVTEFKRVSEIAKNNNYKDNGNSHGWVRFYSHSNPLASPISTPNNTINQNFTQLSPYSKALDVDRDGVPVEVVNPLVLVSPNRVGAELVDDPIIETENALRLKAIKEEWIAKEMRAREAQFTTYEQIGMLVGTWNVNGKAPPSTLQPWIVEGFQKYEVDLLVLGFQELDLSTEAFIVNDGTKEEAWCNAVEASLGEKSPNYMKLISRQLIGVFLVIYIKSDKIHLVTDIATDSAGVGIMGMMGNKGAVSIRFRYQDSYLCFVNSHLAADTSQVERRNQDYQEICRRIGFPPAQKKMVNGLPLPYTFNPTPIFKATAMTLPRNPKLASIFDADHLIWMGDLNYRVALPAKEVRDRLELKEYDFLMRFDQLKIQQAAKKVFTDFKEGEINFPPSYKYDVGTDTFDSSEKKRVPSWCDRVLWRSSSCDEEVMQQLSYRSHMELLTSDHKPVSAIFVARTKQLSLSKYTEVYTAMVRELDKFENLAMPDAAISTNQLHFGEVRYLQSKELQLTIENVGQVYFQFQFIPKGDETQVCKNWLWINPPSGIIMPGEKLRVTFILLVDRRSAPELNTNADQLDDILILHLVNGKDYFVSVSGAYLPTCFGLSLDHLTRMPKPIRQLGCDHADQLYPVEYQHSVPMVLWRIIDFLHEYGMECENLFLNSGDQATMVYIRECLDTGDPFDVEKLLAEPATEDGESQHVPRNEGIHSMAESLIRILEALPDPVIPFHLYDICLEAATLGREASFQVLETLPRVHLNTFLYIVAFLKEVIAYHDSPQQNPIPPPITYPKDSQSHRPSLGVEHLAVVFSSVMLRPKREYSERYDKSTEKKKWFLMAFLLPETENL